MGAVETGDKGRGGTVMGEGGFLAADGAEEEVNGLEKG